MTTLDFATVADTASPLCKRVRSKRCEMRQAERAATKLLRRLDRAKSDGDTKTVSYLTRNLVKSRAVKLAAMSEAGQQCRRTRKPYILGAALLDIAPSFHIWEETGEAARIFRLRKSDGSYRPVISYEQMEKARQSIVAHAVRSNSKLDPRQYAEKGRGINAAARRVRDHIDQGYKFAVEVDIKSFYSSINPHWLKAMLPIDEQLVGSVVLSANVEKVPHHYEGALNRYPYYGPASLGFAAQRGLPQGACSSPIVAEVVVAEIMKEVPEGLAIVNFADNFLVMGRTRRECENALTSLSNAIERSPAGFFEVQTKKVTEVRHGVNFLGFQFARELGSARVRLPEKKLSDFQKTAIHETLRAARTGAPWRKLYTVFAGWRSSSAPAPVADLFVIHTAMEIHRRLPGARSLLDPIIAKLRSSSLHADILAGLP